MTTTTNKNKIYILFPIELLNKKNNYNSSKYNYIIFYLISFIIFLIYILNIINFITHNHSNNYIKTFHLFIILFVTKL